MQNFADSDLPIKYSNRFRFFSKLLNEYVEFLRLLKVETKAKKLYNPNLQKKLNLVSNKIMYFASALEEELPQFLKTKIRELFRISVSKYVFESKFFKRFYDKPNGYPGDFIMFELLYDGEPISNGIGRYFDKYVLGHLLTRSIIGRKNLMKEILFHTIKKSKADTNILNIGCGSCREVRELIKKQKIHNRNINFTFVDHDPQSLTFSKMSLGSRFENWNMEFINTNILDIIGLKTKFQQPWTRKYDLIYSMGVVDYFRDNLLEAFIKRCYRQLKPGARLIFASCASFNPELYAPIRWFSEWNIYTREPQQLRNFIKDRFKIQKVPINWESQRQIYFVTLIKP